ncbi:MAG: hypothetical protein KAW92_10650 [Candidatus Cloacimonetes bacterium]|nr:hypothetical protein [Candidatus Cloacimonadota bacterium]
MKQKRKIKKRRQIDWDKVKDRMVKYVTDVLQEKWKTPIILDVYELNIEDVSMKKKSYDGFVGFLAENNEVYINFIGVRKQRNKEYKTYVIAHELGHVLDFIELTPLKTEFHVINDSSVLNKRNKRVLYEREKRAHSKGFDLLKRAGVYSYYLERFVEYRSMHLAAMVEKFRNKK